MSMSDGSIERRADRSRASADSGQRFGFPVTALSPWALAHTGHRDDRARQRHRDRHRLPAEVTV